MPTFRVEADYRPFRGARLLVVRAYINTYREGHPFLVDPGSPRTKLHRRLVRLYGLADGPEILEELAVYPSPYDASLALAGRQPNIAFDSEEWSLAERPADGVLGMNWFQRYVAVCLHMTTDDDGPFLELTT